MFCVDCGQNDGIELDTGDLSAEAVMMLCSVWRCPTCLDEADRAHHDQIRLMMEKTDETQTDAAGN